MTRPSWIANLCGFLFPRTNIDPYAKKLFHEIEPQENLVPDTHHTAPAIEHGLILCSIDRDIFRFPGLKWENPIS